MAGRSFVHAGDWGRDYGRPTRLAPDFTLDGVGFGDFSPATVPPTKFTHDPTGATFTSGGPVPRGHGPYLGFDPLGRMPIPLKSRGRGGSLKVADGAPLSYGLQSNWSGPREAQSVTMSTMLMHRYQYVRANLPDKRPYNVREMGVMIGMNSMINPALEFQRQDLRKKNADEEWDTALDRAYEKLIRARERRR